MIEKEIINKLHFTETKHDVKIPFAIESGSRSWGFASPDSDYDCRFIYIHKKDYYLSVFEKKDFIEYAFDGVFDINGWDLKKALLHISKSNAVMFEWLSSNDIYICDDYFRSTMQSLSTDFFNPISISYHYLNIAKKKLDEIILTEESKLKTYFYILRPLANLNFIHIHQKMPYMEYSRTLSEIEVKPKILSAIEELMEIKSSSDEKYKIKTNRLLINYFQDEIQLHEKLLKDKKFTKSRDYEEIDNVFKKLLIGAWEE